MTESKLTGSDSLSSSLSSSANLFSDDAVFIGLDYGTGKIGVAVGQLLTGTASIQSPIANQRLQIDWTKFKSLYAQWRPQAWVVGVPLQLDGSRSTVTRLARRFIELLQHQFPIPVYPADEQLTTQEAKRRIYRGCGGRGFHNHSIDSVAAKLILEAWMQQVLHHRTAI